MPSRLRGRMGAAPRQPPRRRESVPSLHRRAPHPSRSVDTLRATFPLSAFRAGGKGYVMTVFRPAFASPTRMLFTQHDHRPRPHLNQRQRPVAAAALTEKLLARKVENARAQLGNVALQLVTTTGTEKPSRLAFAVDNIDAAFKTAERRALKPNPPGQGKTLALDTQATFGVPISLVERGVATLSPQLADSPVTGLDHVVVRTTHPNRAVALYGRRLRLDLHLDRTEPKWGPTLHVLPLRRSHHPRSCTI